MKPPDSSAPPMILLSAGVFVLVQVAWILRHLYLDRLTELVNEVGRLLGYT